MTDPTPTPGIHHVTCIAGDPQRTLDFWTEVLGLRLVKRSVNQDDPGTYHFFFADADGTPGTSMTFFPWGDFPQGTVGSGQVSRTAFRVPEGSLDYWETRFDRYDVDVLPAIASGRQGRGTIHHVAFQTPTADATVRASQMDQNATPAHTRLATSRPRPSGFGSPHTPTGSRPRT